MISGRLVYVDCANQRRCPSGRETHLPLCLGPFHAACSGAPSPAAARQHHPSSTRPVLAQAADTLLHPCECNRFCPSLHLLSAPSTAFSSWPASSHSFVCPRPCLHPPLHPSLLPVARLRSVASTAVVLLSLLVLSGLRSPLLVLFRLVALFLSNPRPPWQIAPRSDCLPLTTRRTHSRACTPGLATPPAPRHR